VRDALFRFRREQTTPRPTLEDLRDGPTFTPFTKAPAILNRQDVLEAMERHYPALLRDAGIGGTVRLYFLIDEDGAVRDALVDRSSGHEALDAAALRVAKVYRFDPAMNRDEPVPVWVSFPVAFEVH
jgi:TonB family protein